MNIGTRPDRRWGTRYLTMKLHQCSDAFFRKSTGTVAGQDKESKRRLNMKRRRFRDRQKLWKRLGVRRDGRWPAGLDFSNLFGYNLSRRRTKSARCGATAQALAIVEGGGSGSGGFREAIWMRPNSSGRRSARGAPSSPANAAESARWKHRPVAERPEISANPRRRPQGRPARRLALAFRAARTCVCKSNRV